MISSTQWTKLGHVESLSDPSERSYHVLPPNQLEYGIDVVYNSRCRWYDQTLMWDALIIIIIMVYDGSFLVSWINSWSSAKALVTRRERNHSPSHRLWWTTSYADSLVATRCNEPFESDPSTGRVLIDYIDCRWSMTRYGSQGGKAGKRHQVITTCEACWNGHVFVEITEAENFHFNHRCDVVGLVPIFSIFLTKIIIIFLLA